jgi:acyl transferase domain-containing protein
MPKHLFTQGRQCFSTPKKESIPQLQFPPGLVPISGICPAIEHFDTSLFAGAGLSLADWRHLDPQIRMLALHAHSALEQAGHAGNRQRKPKPLRIGCNSGFFGHFILERD